MQTKHWCYISTANWTKRSPIFPWTVQISWNVWIYLLNTQKRHYDNHVPVWFVYVVSPKKPFRNPKVLGIFSQQMTLTCAKFATHLRLLTNHYHFGYIYIGDSVNSDKKKSETSPCSHRNHHEHQTRPPSQYEKQSPPLCHRRHWAMGTWI